MSETVKEYIVRWRRESSNVDLHNRINRIPKAEMIWGKHPSKVFDKEEVEKAYKELDLEYINYLESEAELAIKRVKKAKEKFKIRYE